MAETDNSRNQIFFTHFQRKSADFSAFSAGKIIRNIDILVASSSWLSGAEASEAEAGSGSLVFGLW